jgi:hypothetical protein
VALFKASTRPTHRPFGPLSQSLQDFIVSGTRLGAPHPCHNGINWGCNVYVYKDWKGLTLKKVGYAQSVLKK